MRVRVCVCVEGQGDDYSTAIAFYSGQILAWYRFIHSIVYGPYHFIYIHLSAWIQFSGCLLNVSLKL